MNARRLGLGLALVLSSTALACSSGSAQDGSQEAPSPVVAAPPAQTPAPVDSAATPPVTTSPPPTTPSADAGPAPGACGASTLCLDVSSLRQGTTPHAGRLVLVWRSLVGGPSEIGYDAPFAGTETQIQIPLAGVTPPSDANAFCEKTGTGQCTGPVKLGFGIVAVLDDSGTGKAALGEIALGLSDAKILFSQTALKPPPKGYTWAGVPMDQAFPSGVEQGANAYTAPQGNFQELIPAQAGATFKLQVCDTNDGVNCSVKSPFAP